MSFGENLITLGLASSVRPSLRGGRLLVMRWARRKRAVRDLSMMVFITFPN